MKFFREQLWPFLLALTVHVALVFFLVVNVDWETKTVRPALNAEVVQAVVIDETKIKAEQEKLRKEEERRKQQERERQQKVEDEKKKIAELEKQRKESEQKAKEAEQQRVEAETRQKEEQRKAEEVRLKREKEEKDRQAKLEAEKKRKAEEEKKKKAEAEKKRKEEERKKKEEAERKKKEEAERKKREQEQRMREAQELLEKQMEEELKALDAATSRERARLLDIYKETVRQHVQRYWRQPPGMEPSMSCVVRVTQLPSGEVLDAKPVSCSTPDSNFQKSVVDAVLKSSPLPRPPDPALYERVIDFKFEPGK